VMLGTSPSSSASSAVTTVFDDALRSVTLLRSSTDSLMPRRTISLETLVNCAGGDVIRVPPVKMFVKFVSPRTFSSISDDLIEEKVTDAVIKQPASSSSSTSSAASDISMVDTSNAPTTTTSTTPTPTPSYSTRVSFISWSAHSSSPSSSLTAKQLVVKRLLKSPSMHQHAAMEVDEQASVVNHKVSTHLTTGIVAIIVFIVIVIAIIATTILAAPTIRKKIHMDRLRRERSNLVFEDIADLKWDEDGDPVKIVVNPLEEVKEVSTSSSRFLTASPLRNLELENDHILANFVYETSDESDQSEDESTFDQSEDDDDEFDDADDVIKRIDQLWHNLREDDDDQSDNDFQHDQSEDSEDCRSLASVEDKALEWDDAI